MSMAPYSARRPVGQDAQRRHFEAARDAGDPRYLRLIGLGALDTIARAQRWLAAERGRLVG